jgi:hypothetical protein
METKDNTETDWCTITPELRFVLRGNDKQILQQKWTTCVGSDEWRDVPLVTDGL